MRSGSGFHQLPEALIAEFYRRQRTPLLRLMLNLGESQIEETLLHAENHKRTHWRRKEETPWGVCEFQQTVRFQWLATLRNEGLASARHLEFTLNCSTGSQWEICTFEREIKKVRTGDGWEQGLVPIPWPVPKFVPWENTKGFGALDKTLHPGQEVVIARGMLSIPATAQPQEILDLVVEGSAFADDSPPYRLLKRIAAEEIRLLLTQILRDKAKPASRFIPEPEFHARDL